MPERRPVKGPLDPPHRRGGSGPTKREVYGAARDYVSSGLSMIPITADGRKMPAFELLPRVWDASESRHKRIWSCYKERRPTRGELRAWFRDSQGEYGFAILGGSVSGGVEIIDCDSWDVAVQWSTLVAKKAPGLLDRLVRVRSPRPGLHVYYRSESFGGNQKLARVADPANDNLSPKTIIEVKGEAGYCLAPPSPAACHPTGRCYEYIGTNDLTSVPTIDARERGILLDCARKLDCWLGPERPTYSPRRRRRSQGRLARPGDDFNARADWAEILEPHGWRWVRRCGEVSDQWRRPGKARGVSASTDFGGSELLFVFSANAAPFDEWRAYTKFAAYALLEHDGDFGVAARALARRGYGMVRGKGRRRSPDPFGRYAEYARRCGNRSG